MKTFLATLLLVPCMAFAQGAVYKSQLPDAPDYTNATPTPKPKPLDDKKPFVNVVKPISSQYTSQLPSSGTQATGVSLRLEISAIDKHALETGQPLSIQVTSLAHFPINVQTVILFLNNNDAVMDDGIVNLSFAQAGTQNFTFDPRAVHQRLSVSHRMAGSKKSWIVQAYVDGKLVAWKASSPSQKLEAIAQTVVKLPPEK